MKPFKHISLHDCCWPAAEVANIKASATASHAHFPKLFIMSRKVFTSLFAATQRIFGGVQVAGPFVECQRGRGQDAQAALILRLSAVKNQRQRLAMRLGMLRRESDEIIVAVVRPSI